MTIIDLNLKPTASNDLIKTTKNIYETILILITRARYLNDISKTKLDRLLDEFGSPSGVNDISYLDECEAICTSSDAQLKPHLQAMMEFLNGDLVWKANVNIEENEL